MKKICLFFVITFVSMSAFAQFFGQNQNNPALLFDKWIKILEKPLTDAVTPEEAVENLLTVGESRIAAFNVQALGRTFSAVDPEFALIRYDFKKIEDALGKIDKWEKLNYATLAQQAKEEFAELLNTEGWYGPENKLRYTRHKIVDLMATVENSEVQILGHLAEVVRSIYNTEYDFSGLESVNGLHEYRREIRWFLIETRMLDGLLSFKEDEEQCPSPGLFDIFNIDIVQKSKYSQLPLAKKGQYTCEVSACLFYGLSDTVEKIGKIKDDVEEEFGDSGSDETPQKYKVKAERVYNLINETNAFNLLADEIDECTAAK